MEKWRPKLFISDWDGTLFDSCALHIACVKHIFKHFGLEPPPIEMIRSGLATKNFMEFLAAHGIPKTLTHPELRKDLWDPYVNEHWEKARPYPWTQRLLAKLKYHQVPIVVVSGTAFEPLTKRMLEWGFFDMIRSVCPDAFDRKKTLEGILFDQDTDRQEIIYMDDIASGILAGKEVGVLTIAITHGIQSREILEGARPDILVHSLDEVIERLEEGNFS